MRKKSMHGRALPRGHIDPMRGRRLEALGAVSLGAPSTFTQEERHEFRAYGPSGELLSNIFRPGIRGRRSYLTHQQQNKEEHAMTGNGATSPQPHTDGLFGNTIRRRGAGQGGYAACRVGEASRPGPSKKTAAAYLQDLRDYIAQHGAPPKETKGNPGYGLAKKIRTA